MIKLFLRDQSTLFIMNIIQLSLTLLILWVSGFQEISLLLYILFLSTFVLTIFLIHRYLSLRNFYRRLAYPIDRMDEVFEAMDKAQVSLALSELLKRQHRLYMNEIEYTQSKKNEHMTFINQWVHQMKTPLSIIELIAQEQEDEQVRSIQEETEKLEKGLEMVLYAARLEVFERDFNVQPVSLKETVERGVHDNKRLFIKNQVYPEISLTDRFVESDEKWLAFIINQILTNAVKYSAGKGNKIYISEKINPEGIQLHIEDQGVGIPPSDLKRVFDAFFTGENGRTFRESTGMGLSLVRDVCNKLGHTVEIESEQGKGTIVKLTFFT